MTTAAQARSPLRTLAIVAAAGIPLLTIGWVWLRMSTRERGAQLFQGGTTLTGRLVGHDGRLPSEALQCTNCHGLESDASPNQAKVPTQALTERVGPRLGPSSLTLSVKRRGGPASEYTADSFCRLLREGIDPAQVMIPQLMPRYTLTDAECNELWFYLKVQ